MLIALAAIIAGFLVLLWSADQFVAGAAAIARNLGLSPVIIGLTIVSIGTSAPEVLVSLAAALSGAGELAVGNAIGSNIANIGWRAGGDTQYQANIGDIRTDGIAHRRGISPAGTATHDQE